MKMCHLQLLHIFMYIYTKYWTNRSQSQSRFKNGRLYLNAQYNRQTRKYEHVKSTLIWWMWHKQLNIVHTSKKLRVASHCLQYTWLSCFSTGWDLRRTKHIIHSFAMTSLICQHILLISSTLWVNEFQLCFLFAKYRFVFLDLL